MHDPDVVAFTIVRPWPQRSRWHDAKAGGRRWQIRHHHTCAPGSASCDGCQGRTNGQMFPWWRPGSYGRFWTLAGRGIYWPALITVWHREPGGHDALSVCQRRIQGQDGHWRYKGHWQWHIWHWRLQIHPYQFARRRLLTRCEWCSGHDRKGAPVNHSASWHHERVSWWRGERGLFHQDCLTVQGAHRTCMCSIPVLEHNGYGTCVACGKFRPWRRNGYVPDEADLLLAALPEGSRIPASLKPRLDALWAQRRAARETAS